MTYLITLFEMAVFLALAPLVSGVLDWLGDRSRGGRGPSPLQPYRDLFKLFRTATNVPASASIIFPAAALVVFFCYFFLGVQIPLLYHPGSEGVLLKGDLLLAIYLLGLARFAAGLAAFDSGEVFGPMSSARQLFMHVLIEPALLLVLYAFALVRHSTHALTLITPSSLIDVVAGLLEPVMMPLLLGLIIIVMAETGRLPFDNPHGRLELGWTEGGTEAAYGGRALALLKLGHALRLHFFLSLLAGLAFPWFLAERGALPLLGALLAYLLRLLLLIGFVAFWDWLFGKLPLYKVPTYLLFGAVLVFVAIAAATFLPGMAGG